MMRALVLAMVVLLAGGVARAQDKMGVVSQQTLDCVKVLIAQQRAWNAGNLDEFMKGYKNSPETIFVSRDGVQKGYEPVADRYKRSYPTKGAMGELEFSDFEVKGLDEMFAVVTGKFHLERAKKDGGNADGIFSLVMEKTDDGWKIVVDHTS